MAQKTRLVIINVPDKKVAELEKFLKDSKKKGQLVRILKSKGRGEIWEISKQETKKFKSNHYEAIVCGGNKEAKKFIHSLFTNNLIPEGKKWQVLGPISDKFIRQ